MNKIYFKNPGLIEMSAVTTMGISAKETDTAIGQFGTGLKYAIAIILRLGGNISIYRGKEQHLFSTRKQKVRNEEFDIVTMDDIDIGFTTHLGAHWESWMAFREIYSNMLDEKGETLFELPTLDDESTIVAIDCNEMVMAYRERSKYFLESVPLHVGREVDIHRGESSYVFYRGIRAHGLEKPSMFTYNIQAKRSLTEDRTLADSYMCKGIISRDVTYSTKEILEKTVFQFKGFFEESLDYDWMDVNEDSILIKVMQNAYEKHFIVKAHKSAKKVFYKLREINDDKSDWDLDEIEKEILEDAFAICGALGFSTIRELSIIFKRDLGTNILGQAFEGNVYISKEAFISGGAQKIAGTLIEEYAHISLGHTDESRSFQNWLLDQLAFAGVRLDRLLGMSNEIV